MHQHRTTIRRVIAAGFSAIATSALIGGALTGPAAATPPNVPDRVSDGATWLVHQLKGAKSDHYVDVYDKVAYPDYGNTIDGILALDAAHTAQAAAKRMTSWLAANIKGYAVAYCTGGTTSYYPGSLAKSMLAVEAQGGDVHDFGGLDLVSLLKSEEIATGADAGLYSGDDSAGDCTYPSPITQAYALIALSNTGSAADKPDAAAVRWLRGQVCPDGGYEDGVRSTPASCPAADQDADGTAFVVQALQAVGSTPAADRSVRWILGHQGKTGGLQHNSNSTAIAVQAMLVTRHFKAAALSIHFLWSHQLLCRAPFAREGAIDYEGSYDTAGNQELESTTQSEQAIARAPLGAMTRKGATSATPKTYCH